MSNDTQWIDGLVVGTKVIISGRNGMSVTTVEKITNTQIHVKAGTDIRKFNKKNGAEIGSADKWYTPDLLEPTENRLAIIRDTNTRNKSINTIKSQDLNTLTTDQLTRIAAVMNEGK